MSEMPALDHDPVIYPDSDGEPMAENEVQGYQIMRLVQQLQNHFRGSDDIHFGFDLLWYPVKGDPRNRRAPDVFVVPGRPAGPARPSWLQWKEDGVPMRHVVEIVSPVNSATEMADKRAWYSRYGVEEYLVFHPEPGLLEVHIRTDLGLAAIDVELPWTSPLLEGCQYDVEPGVPVIGEHLHDLVLLDPNGHKVETADDLFERANAEARRADALEAKLRAAGIDPDSF